jgi:hypothetical protein
MAQQTTAVEWIIQQLPRNYRNNSDWYKIFKQAKEMEKQQAFEYFKAGQDSTEEGGKSFEQYYTETYGK